MIGLERFDEIERGSKNVGDRGFVMLVHDETTALGWTASRERREHDVATATNSARRSGGVRSTIDSSREEMEGGAVVPCVDRFGEGHRSGIACERDEPIMFTNSCAQQGQRSCRDVVGDHTVSVDKELVDQCRCTGADDCDGL